MGSTPVASGSRVPAWPALRASNSRRTALTACVDVMPAGLSSTSQPWIALPFLRRAMACSGLLQVLRHLRRAEYLVDAPCLVEGLVGREADVGCELEVYGMRNLAADVALVALERRQHGPHVLAAERHHVDGGKLEVRRHAYLGDGDHVTRQHVVVDFASAQHLGQRMTDQLAHAKLAL